MRTVMILAATALTLASVQDAEARGRRGGGRIGIGAGVGIGSSSSRSEDSSARRAALARGVPVAPEVDPAYRRPILPVRVPSQASAPAPTRSASASCASGRLVGQGVGFCQIN